MKKRILAFVLAAVMVFGNGNLVYAGENREENISQEKADDQNNTDEKKAATSEENREDTVKESETQNDSQAETKEENIESSAENAQAVEKSNELYEYTVDSETGEVTITKYLGNESVVVVPEQIENGKVVAIGGSAFYDCDDLTEVEIPGSVTSIGDYAFQGCENLSAITLNDGLEKIGMEFIEGTKVTELFIPKTVIDMACAVYNAKMLQKLTFGEGMEVLPDFSCANRELSQIELPETLKRIEDFAFSECYNLTKIEIPNNVTSIGAFAFLACRNLIQINLPPNIAFIGMFFIEGTPISELYVPKTVTDMKFALTGPENLKKVVFENGIVEIPAYACGWDHIEDQNITEVIIPDSVRKINQGAFKNCAELSEIDLPSGLEIIGYEAFSNCTKLENIKIPKNVQTIGDFAFSNCTGIKDICFFGKAPVFDGKNIFEYVIATAHYPSNDTGWEKVIQQNYGGNITWQSWEPEPSEEDSNLKLLINEDQFQAEYYSKNASTITSGYMTYTEIEDNYTPTQYVLNNILSFGWNKKFGFSDDAQIWETILLDIILQRSASEKTVQNWEEDILQLSDTLCMEALDRDISSLEDQISSANAGNINALLSEYENLKGISTGKSVLDDLMGAADTVGEFLESYATYVELRAFVNDDTAAFLKQMRNTSEYRDIPAFQRALDQVIQTISVDDANLVQLIIQEQASRTILTKAVNTAVGHAVEILIPGVGAVVDLTTETTICMMNTICGTEEQAQVNVYLYMIDRIDQAAEEAFLNAAEDCLASGGNSYQAVNGGLQFITDLSSYGVSVCRQWNRVISTDILSRIESGPYMSVNRPHYDMTNDYLNLGHASTEKEKNEYIEELCLDDEKFIDTVLRSMPGFAQAAWYEESGAAQNDAVSLVLFYVINPTTDSRVMYTQVVPTNSTVSFPDLGKKNGYVTPSTWYLDPECTQEADSSQKITGNTVFYTKWRPSIFYEQAASGGISIVSMNAEGGGIGGRAVRSADHGLFLAESTQMSGVTYEIPAYIDGYRVEALGDDIFAGCADASRVILPGTLLSISDSAFESLGTDTVYQYVEDSVAEEYVQEKQFPNTESTRELVFTETPEQLQIGQTVQLKLQQDGSCISDTVIWSSSDETVASVSNGTVTALKEGTAMISATVGGVTVSFELTVTVKSDVEKGDLNHDGTINVVDLMMSLHHVSGRTALEGDALTAADINGDGMVNVVDLMRMLHYVSGRNTSL